MQFCLWELFAPLKTLFYLHISLPTSCIPVGFRSNKHPCAYPVLYLIPVTEYERIIVTRLVPSGVFTGRKCNNLKTIIEKSVADIVWYSRQPTRWVLNSKFLESYQYVAVPSLVLFSLFLLFWKNLCKFGERYILLMKFNYYFKFSFIFVK